MKQLLKSDMFWGVIAYIAAIVLIALNYKNKQESYEHKIKSNIPVKRIHS